MMCPTPFSRLSRKVLSPVGIAMLLFAATAQAQDVAPQAAPAYIAAVEGAADVERDGVSEPAAVNAPLVPGDRLRTMSGRVEVLFPDGTALDVDEYAAVELQGPALLRLNSGRVLIIVSRAGDPSAAIQYQIDTPAASARTDGPGEYRISVRDGRVGAETELAVRRGTASLETDRGTMPIGAGEWTVARDGEDPAYAHVFNSARYDAFDLWAFAQRDARTGARSAQYLPAGLRMYGGTFDRDGSWEYDEPYGYVWYPTVAPDWRPYYHGYWAAYRPWGWTWIGLDSWAWPTHHYGRWGLARNRWFWIPGRSWGAAWVSWASAPGYVSWCPLGFDGRPVFAVRDGWTTVPRHAFGVFARADRHAVAPHTVPQTTPFVAHRAAPIEVPRVPQRAPAGPTRGLAVPRESVVGSRESVVGSRVPRPRDYAIPRPPTSGLSTTDSRLPITDSRAVAPPRAATPDSRQPTTDSRAVAPRARRLRILDYRLPTRAALLSRARRRRPRPRLRRRVRRLEASRDQRPEQHAPAVTVGVRRANSRMTLGLWQGLGIRD